jgi:hypothetical protein
METSMSFHSKTPLIASAIVLMASVAKAGENDAAMQAFLDSTIMPFAENEVLVTAIEAQNAANAGLTQADIDALDAKWRAEISTSDTPTITPVLENAASDYLRAQVDASKGAITEIFVMDAKGLNVAASATTSDYWQGDEAKFSDTYPNGAGATNFGDIELDESTGTYQAQISVTITDPATGEAIGAMTVGVNAEALF